MPRPQRKDFPDFSKLNLDFKQLLRKLPALIGNTALNFYKDSWNREAYIDATRERWPKRKRTTGKARRTLVKTGRLRRSLRYRTQGNLIRIFTDVPYAQIHNEGGRVSGTASVKAHTRRPSRRVRRPVAVRAHTRRVSFNMPQRQFMDIPGTRMSRLLEKRLRLLVERAVTQVVNKTR